MSVIRVINATVIYPSHPWHQTQQSFDIVNGILSEISDREADTIYEEEGMVVCPGLFDFHFRTGEPGFEYKETLKSGSEAAYAGGFTDVLLMSNQTPPTDNSGAVLALKEKTENLSIQFHIAGTLSEKRQGEHLAELFDMHHAGAIAFTDDKRAIQDAGLVQRSLLYKINSNFPVLIFADETVLAHNGVANEGVESTSLGLKGRPGLAEEVHVSRNIQIAGYSNSSIHLSNISTAKSVELVREAKKQDIPVTCSVSIANLIWNETELAAFDTNFKLLPPLRNEADRKALIEGVNDGTIDVIASDHTPESTEDKFCEFDFARNGMSLVQAFYPLYQTHLSEEISLETFVEKTSINPRRILNLDLPLVEAGLEAKLTVIIPSKKIVFENSNWISLSKNFTEFGKTLTGQAINLH